MREYILQKVSRGAQKLEGVSNSEGECISGEGRYKMEGVCKSGREKSKAGRGSVKVEGEVQQR